MKRILLVAADRALTRFVAESLLERSVDAPPKAGDDWDVARAHTPLEAQVLVTHGDRTFDVMVVDQDLDGADPVELLDVLRAAAKTKEIPLFLITERGRDPHVRRIAVDRHRAAGFIDKPVTAQSIRRTLGSLERRRRILLVEPDEDRAERYRSAMERHGYVVDHVLSGRDSLDRAPRFVPDAVVASLVLPDLKGLEVCVALKQAHRSGSLPVVLYGQVTQLGHHGIDENAHRADDFVQAPFDDEILVNRVARLVGIGPGGKVVRRRRSALDRLPKPDLESEQPTLSDLPNVLAEDDDDTQRGKSQKIAVPDIGATFEGVVEPDDDEPAPPDTETPPPSASPSAVGPTRRSTRRVPCTTAMSVRNGAKVYRSRTLDISHGGIFLAADEPLDIGERIDMAFKVPGNEATIRAVGKVCWLGRGGAEQVQGVGVKFSRIDPNDLKVIVDYVNRVARVLYSAAE